MDKSDQERIDRMLEIHQSTLQRLVEERTLLLTVEVNTVEDADQILTWMYCKDEKPMSADLLSISWDKVPASKKVVDLIERLKEELSS